MLCIPCRYTSLTVGKKPVSEIRHWLSVNYWKFPSGLFFSSLYVWIPIQLVNLYWVPLPFRVLYMNISVMVCTHRRPPLVEFACESDGSVTVPRLCVADMDRIPRYEAQQQICEESVRA